jgi:hypothetical protein
MRLWVSPGVGGSRPQACGQSRPSVQWVTSSSGQPPGESTTTPARSALLGSESSPTNPGASCSSCASRSPARSSAGRRWGPAAARLQPAATPGWSRPGTRRVPPKRTPHGECPTPVAPSQSPRGGPPPERSPSRSGIRVGTPPWSPPPLPPPRPGTRHRRGGGGGGGRGGYRPAPLPTPSPPGPCRFTATAANRCHMATWQPSFSGSARVLHRQELGHASSQPCRAHPGRKTS